MSQQQIKKKSGIIYHISLDSISAICLAKCRTLFQSINSDLSNNVIVRRALRQYKEWLESSGNMELEQEVVEAIRAGKGIH